jgi:acyl-CoA reductase-like NAD-dependent aldehyde dehydrogenase
MSPTIISTSIVVTNPNTIEKLYEIQETEFSHIEKIYSRARQVQKQIENLTIEQRIQEVLKINDYIIANREKIIDRIVAETGKARFDALVSEVFEVCDVIDHFKKAAPKILADKKMHTPIVLMGKKSKVCFQPLGAILVITPWNYPFFQGMAPSILAFLAGNAVIVKPSEFTPLKGLWEEILSQSDFMKDAFQFVYGGRETGKMLIDAKPDKIHFTGSVATGKKIMEQAAKQLIPVELELGGKDPAIVFEDVNLERTVNGVMWAAFTNSGQSCTSIERLYVHESIYDNFVKLLIEKTNKLRLPSSQTDYQKPDAYDLGGITSSAQLSIIEKHVRDAVQKGAKVLIGGKREENSRQFLPTIITDVNNSMLIMIEETFGPVLPLVKFKTEEEAIKLANDSVYGLSASVWSKDIKRAERVAKKLVTGNVSINSHMLTEGNPALPFGGVKESGIGRSKGEWGLLGFTNVKSIIIDQQSSRIESHWYPYTQTKYELLSKLMVALFSRSKNMLKFALLGLKMDSLGTKEKIR